MSDHDTREALAMIAAKIRWGEHIESADVLRSMGARLRQEWGDAQIERFVHYSQQHEISAALRDDVLLRRPKPAPAIAKIIAEGIAAKAKPWLWARGKLDLDRPIPLGPANPTPNVHIGPGGDPRKSTAASNVRVVPSRAGYQRVEGLDFDSMLEHARAQVSAERPGLSGQAFHAAVNERFQAIREGAKKGAIAAATPAIAIPKPAQPAQPARPAATDPTTHTANAIHAMIDQLAGYDLSAIWTAALAVRARGAALTLEAVRAELAPRPTASRQHGRPSAQVIAALEAGVDTPTTSGTWIQGTGGRWYRPGYGGTPAGGNR